MATIKVDGEVYRWIQSLAEPLEDTPNSVLRRVAGLDKSDKPSRTDGVFDNPEWSTLIIGNGPPLTAGGWL